MDYNNIKIAIAHQVRGEGEGGEEEEAMHGCRGGKGVHTEGERGVRRGRPWVQRGTQRWSEEGRE